MEQFSLHALRILRGLTLETVAKNCGLSIEKVKDVEVDSSMISYELLLAAADILRVNPDIIYVGAESDLSLGVTNKSRNPIKRNNPTLNMLQ